MGLLEAIRFPHGRGGLRSPARASCARLPEGPFLFPADFLTDQPERALVAEWIREKVLHHTRQELPHHRGAHRSVEERADGLTAIEASILVERDSRRSSWWEDGALVKRIGSEARAEIEGLLGAGSSSGCGSRSGRAGGTTSARFATSGWPERGGCPLPAAIMHAAEGELRSDRWPREMKQRRDEAYVLGIHELAKPTSS